MLISEPDLYITLGNTLKRNWNELTSKIQNAFKVK